MNPQPISVSAGPGRRILLVSTGFGIGGGAEEQVMLLALGMHLRGWLVKIVSLLPLGPQWPELSQAGIPVESLNMSRRFPDPRALFHLKRIVRDFRPDVVHSHMGHANLMTRAVRILQPYPALVNTMHLITLEHQDGRPGTALEIAHRYTDRWTDLTTAICKPAVEYYETTRTVPRGRISVVYNGVRTARLKPNRDRRERVRQELGLEHSFVWLAVGRLVVAKAYPVMLRAFKQLLARETPESIPNVLLICSSGPLDEELKALVVELGIQERARFLGIRKDIPDLMNAADSFVLSSVIEGLPMVLLEASASGLPIVSTDVAGNAEVVLDGKSGFLVPSGQPDQLAAAMRRMYELPEETRQAMGEAGQEYVRRNFELDRILDCWETVYSGLLEKREGATGAARS